MRVAWLACVLLGGCGSLAPTTGWRGLTVGSDHACALHGDRVYCWGENGVGELGVGPWRGHRYTLLEPLPRWSPARVAGRGWTGVGASDSTTCGVRRGRLYCWGDGAEIDGFLGVEREVFRHPVRIDARDDWRTITPGMHPCGTLADGQLRCLRYSIGERDRMDRLGRSTGWSALVASNKTSAGILHGRLWVWEPSDPQQAVMVPGARPWLDVAAGDGHTCGIQEGGELYCWGDNEYGQLGDGTTTGRDAPQRIGAGWSDVSAGGQHTCGIREGQLYCWGVLAIGLPHDSNVDMWHRPPTVTPRLADPQRDWIAVEASEYLVCGLRAGGRIACRAVPLYRMDAARRPERPDEAVPTSLAPPGTRRGS